MKTRNTDRRSWYDGGNCLLLCRETNFELRKENDMSPRKKVITAVIGAVIVILGIEICFRFYNKSDTVENRQQLEAT